MLAKFLKWIEFNVMSINSIIQTGDAPDQQEIADGPWKFVIAGQTDTKTVTHNINDLS